MNAKYRILKNSLLLLPLVSCAGIAAEKPSQEYWSFFRASQVSTQSADVADGSTELQRDSLFLNAGVNIPLDQQWSLGFRVGYDRLNYDWDNIQFTGTNNVASLFGSNGQPWDNIDRYSASFSLNYKMDKHWAFLLAPQIQYAYADTASSSNAKSYGVVISAMYTFDSGNMIGFGGAYLNDIDEVRTVPYLSIHWKINENWTLSNPFQAGFSGPAGLELSYRFNSDWDIGFGSSRRTERFLIEDDDTVVETNEWVSYLRAGWQATPALTMNLVAGYYFNGELEATNQSELDMDNQAVAGLDIEFKF